VYISAKLAVTVAEPVTVKPNEVCVPEGHADDALPVQLQPVKEYPAVGVSEIVAVWPESYSPPPVTVPPAGGLA
jgi:hypothetical protein